MGKGKVLELGEELTMSGKHFNLYFQNRNWQAECLPLKGRAIQDMAAWLPYVEEDALALRVPIEQSGEVIQQFPQLPTAVRWLETSDILLHDEKSWWPRLFIYEALRKIIVQRFSALNIGLHAYVIGATHAGRAAVAALANVGFSNISLVDEDEVRLKREVEYLKKYVLGVQLKSVPATTLTVQTDPGSLMLNTLELKSESGLLKDLSYFNFMNQGGAVVDVSECCERNLLLEEAERADLKVLTGLEVQSQIDVDLLMKIFPQQYITYDDYFESFSDNLVQLKNSPSV